MQRLLRVLWAPGAVPVLSMDKSGLIVKYNVVE